MTFPPLGNYDTVVSLSIDFSLNSKWDALVYGITCGYYCIDWAGLFDHLRDVPWEDIFKLDVSAGGGEFCEWVQGGIDMYFPDHNF